MEAPPSPAKSPVSPPRPKRHRAEAASDDDEYSDSEPKKKRSSIQSRAALTPPPLEEASFFRALSGPAGKNIPVEALRRLGWSEARIKAFRNRETNPNQYYYRFNDPGEPQATGKWSQKDKALFLQLIKEKGVDYQVGGIFGIPESGVFFRARSPGAWGTSAATSTGS